MLQAILLAHLHANQAFPWPGADGLTTDEALDCYLVAAARGWVPGEAELCCRHPELRDQLVSFFASPRQRPPSGLPPASSPPETDDRHLRSECSTHRASATSCDVF
jgi:hypothetical protein